MKMAHNNFHLLSFQRKVKDALQTVERTLELERKPQLADEVDHVYGAKYGLANLTSNAAIIAYSNCFEKLGLDATVLKSIDKSSKPSTLRFDASTTYNFLKEVKVDVPFSRSYEEAEETKGGSPSENSTKTKVMKAINHVTEYHWEVIINYTISVYSGTDVENKQILKSRKCKSTIITQSRDAGQSPLLRPAMSDKPTTENSSLPPIELSLTWFVSQIDTTTNTSQFKVDTTNEKTITPRRNEAVAKAIDFATNLRMWCNKIECLFLKQMIKNVIQMHNPALPGEHPPMLNTLKQLMLLNEQYVIFNPILPLMEEETSSLSSTSADRGDGNDNGGMAVDGDDSGNTAADNRKHNIGFSTANEDVTDENKVLLSSHDMSKLLDEHVRSIEEAVAGITKSWPSETSDNILSSSEAILAGLCNHLTSLTTQYIESMDYIESMMENQLIKAVGKRLTSKDLSTFQTYHEALLLNPKPRPFSHAIRPGSEHYPVGLLSIESQDGANAECIHTHAREVVSSDISNITPSLKIPLNAATVLELTGQQYLHGYMNHRFGNESKSHQLVARARQFSSFILIVGNMIDGTTLDPKDAIIVQNKDELIIPLLMEELPTAKEFKDAIKGLSEEQQRFAKTYRAMQLASSVFGIAVIQIKPQLEVLLGLPADSLDKEMKLTQDLMELFIEYNVPSDMLSYNGYFEHDTSVADKISNVRDNVMGVMDVINAEKEKQLKEEKAKAEMAKERAIRSVANHFEDDLPCAGTALRGSSGAVAMKSMGGSRMMKMKRSAADTATFGSARAPMMAMASHFRAPADAEYMCMSTEVCDDDMGGMTQPQRQMESPSATDHQTAPSSTDQGEGVDFTLIPQVLDKSIESSGGGSALRATTIKTGNTWVRNRQENLLTQPKKTNLSVDIIKKEKNKAFDLLDALSRSGSLSIAYSDLHVVVALTHCFDKDVMNTIVRDNVNPIEKLENSTLLLASAVHGLPPRELIRDVGELQRLEGSLPLLLQDENRSEV